ncbi:TPA: HIT family protein [Candidatus Woesearchaeota archaeon]|nr:HIT family protein [Candidatus Woesearchaeota archaeon]
MDDCLFCTIIAGKIPSYKVYEDEDTLAFLDIKPHAKGHTVVIPKVHAETTFDLTDTQLQELMVDVQNTLARINDVLHPDGFNVGWNHNTAGGQVVPHLHIHIFPRYKNDGGGSMHSIIKNPGNTPVSELAKLFQEQEE